MTARLAARPSPPGALLGLGHDQSLGVVTILIVLGWLLLLRRYGAACES